MRLRCERDPLVEALSVAGRAVSSRGGSLSVLSGIRLELIGDELQVLGSDLDLTIQADVAVGGDGDGVCVIPARLAADIVRALEPGTVVIDTADDEVRIVSGRSQFSVRMLVVGDFPRLAPTGTAGLSSDAVTLSARDFADALRQVVRAASSDDARPILTGVLMAAEGSGLRMVATDSYRLAVRDLAGVSVLREGQQVLVPSRALTELQRLLSGAEDVTLQLGEHEVTFQVGRTRLTSRLIEGEFPNYRQLIPESYPNRVVVAKVALLDAVRRVKLLVRDATTPARLRLDSDVMNLSVVSSEVGQASEDVDAKYEGSEMTVAFNPAYLMEGVEAVNGDEVLLEIAGALRPAVVRAVGVDDYLYLLMPVRVS
ncbi:MAG: DNA polymerase III subunit beta [Acidimicrobiales bacterium]